MVVDSHPIEPFKYLAWKSFLKFILHPHKHKSDRLNELIKRTKPKHVSILLYQIGRERTNEETTQANWPSKGSQISEGVLIWTMKDRLSSLAENGGLHTSQFVLLATPKGPTKILKQIDLV